jgi:hypothetical protein
MRSRRAGNFLLYYSSEWLTFLLDKSSVRRTARKHMTLIISETPLFSMKKLITIEIPINRSSKKKSSYSLSSLLLIFKLHNGNFLFQVRSDIRAASSNGEAIRGCSR